MKIAAMVLGILGSIVTFFISVFAVALGGLASMVTGEGVTSSSDGWSCCPRSWRSWGRYW